MADDRRPRDDGGVEEQNSQARDWPPRPGQSQGEPGGRWTDGRWAYGRWAGDGEDQPQPGWPGHPSWAGKAPYGRPRRHGLLRWGPGPLRRAREGRLAGGVAAALSRRTGLDVTLVRIGLVAAAVLTSGFVLAAYVLAWLLLPVEGEETNIASKAMSDGRGIALAAGLASVLAMVLIIGTVLGSGWFSGLGWPLLISLVGMVLIWRNAPAYEQEQLRRAAEPLIGQVGRGGWGRVTARALIAVALLIGGMVALFGGHPSHELRPLGGEGLVIVAFVVAFGPWWLRIARDLVTERQARARAEERADMASRVHDSVLQTLALIQRRAEDPQRVVQLARAQERELRAWLFDGQVPGSPGDTVTTLAAGVRLIQQEVEEQHGTSVEAVTVGDCEMDDDLGALLAAAREATVNAVKWSGAPVVSVFAEVEPSEVSIYVRDRGKGFDPNAVPKDRKGLAESIHGRMARRGGSATVRSVPGEGTEVTLKMPHLAGHRA
jgi:signal transduction histidine kinase